MSISGLHFDMYNVNIDNYIIYGLNKSAMVLHSFTYLGLFVYYTYCKSLSYVLNAMYIVLCLQLLPKRN